MKMTDETLVSESQDFELGFFTTGKSRNILLGVWYKTTPDVVAWVANRNNPITRSRGVVLTVSGNGSLVISRSRSIIWSQNSSGVASNPVLRLLDTGETWFFSTTRWRATYGKSFDYPTDTLLPGMKFVDDVDLGVERYLTTYRNIDDPAPGDFSVRIENQGLPEFVVYKGKRKIFRCEKWNGIGFSTLPPFPSSISSADSVFIGFQ